MMPASSAMVSDSPLASPVGARPGSRRHSDAAGGHCHPFGRRFGRDIDHCRAAVAVEMVKSPMSATGKAATNNRGWRSRRRRHAILTRNGEEPRRHARQIMPARPATFGINRRPSGAAGQNFGGRIGDHGFGAVVDASNGEEDGRPGRRRVVSDQNVQPNSKAALKSAACSSRARP